MAVTVRLLVLTALVGVAAAALSAGTSETPGSRPAAPEPGNSAVALTVLAALAAPAIVLVVVAALRFRRAPRPAPAPGPRDARRWWGAIMLLAVLALMVGGAVLAASLARREPAEREAPPATAPPAPDPPEGADPGWLPPAVVLLVVLLVLAAVARRRPVAPAEDRPREAAPRGAAERAPAAVTEPARDARTAIIRCYATMEGALTAVPGLAPRAADSPSEVLARAHRAGAVRSSGTWRLVELFDEARFSRHSMTEPDRTAAESSLRVILDELRSAR